MLPLQLTFVRCAGVGLAVVDVLVDLYFIVDVILNFRTAVDEGGPEVAGWHSNLGPHQPGDLPTCRSADSMFASCCLLLLYSGS